MFCMFSIFQGKNIYQLISIKKKSVDKIIVKYNEPKKLKMVKVNEIYIFFIAWQNLDLGLDLARSLETDTFRLSFSGLALTVKNLK